MKKIYLTALLAFLGVSLISGNVMGQAFRGEGDFEFFLDAGSIPLRSGEILELFQIAVPTKEIEYEEKDGSFKAVVSVYIKLTRDNETVHEKRLMIHDSRESAPDVRDLTGFLYIADSCRVDPGSYLLSVKLEDKNRKKKTLIGWIRKKHNYSAFEDEELAVRDFDHSRMTVSSPVLLWGKQKDGQYIPNPISIYGLKNDTLSFFVQGVLPEGSSADSLDVTMSVIDHKGEIVDFRDVAVPVRKRQVSVLGVFDVNTYPAGGYRVNVALSGKDGLFAATGKDFTVAWELMNWRRPRRDILIEARILFNDNEFDEFQRASIGEQEKILNDFWKKIDPTPHTAVNEAYELFRARVAYANLHYSGFQQGAISDRGLVYIKFGPPDEIIQESVPINRTDLDEVVDKLDDEYKVVLHKTQKGMGTEDASLYTSMHNRGRMYRGGGGMDTGGYELWIYSVKGKPLFERDDLMTIHAGMRYLFVDKDGVGRYVLVGTSEEYEDDGSESTTDFD